MPIPSDSFIEEVQLAEGQCIDAMKASFVKTRIQIFRETSNILMNIDAFFITLATVYEQFEDRETTEEFHGIAKDLHTTSLKIAALSEDADFHDYLVERLEKAYDNIDK